MECGMERRFFAAIMARNRGSSSISAIPRELLWIRLNTQTESLRHGHHALQRINHRSERRSFEIQVHAFDLDGLWQRCREVHGRREARSEIWRVWSDRHIARVSQCKDLLHLANATNLGDT